MTSLDKSILTNTGNENQYYGQITYSNETPVLDLGYILDFDDKGVLKSPFETTNILQVTSVPDSVSDSQTEFMLSVNGFSESLFNNVDIKISGKYLTFTLNAGYSKKFAKKFKDVRISLLLRKFILIKASKISTIIPKNSPNAPATSWIDAVKGKGSFYVNRIANGAVVVVNIDISSISESVYENIQAHIDAGFSNATTTITGNMDLMKEVNSALENRRIAYKSHIIGVDLKTSAYIDSNLLPNSENDSNTIKSFNSFLDKISDVTKYLGDNANTIQFNNIIYYYNQIPSSPIPPDIKSFKLLRIQERWRECNDAVNLISNCLNSSAINQHLSTNHLIELNSKRTELNKKLEELIVMHQKLLTDSNPDLAKYVEPELQFEINDMIPKMWAIRIGNRGEATECMSIVTGINSCFQNSPRLKSIFSKGIIAPFSLRDGWYVVYNGNLSIFQEKRDDLIKLIQDTQECVKAEGAGVFNGNEKLMTIVDLGNHCENLSYHTHFINSQHWEQKGNGYMCNL